MAGSILPDRTVSTCHPERGAKIVKAAVRRRSMTIPVIRYSAIFFRVPRFIFTVQN
jgi:hypothetical protein